MTDAHFHRNGFDTFLVTNGHEVAFHGLHPWQSAACADIPAALAGIRARLEADPRAGVGEIGLDRLKAIHINDSMNPLGNHKDRHAKIGEGHIGLAGFDTIIHHDALRDLPYYLETPCDLDGYAREMALLRRMWADPASL